MACTNYTGPYVSGEAGTTVVVTAPVGSSGDSPFWIVGMGGSVVGGHSTVDPTSLPNGWSVTAISATMGFGATATLSISIPLDATEGDYGALYQSYDNELGVGYDWKVNVNFHVCPNSGSGGDSSVSTLSAHASVLNCVKAIGLSIVETSTAQGFMFDASYTVSRQLDGEGAFVVLTGNLVASGGSVTDYIDTYRIAFGHTYRYFVKGNQTGLTAYSNIVELNCVNDGSPTGDETDLFGCASVLRWVKSLGLADFPALETSGDNFIPSLGEFVAPTYPGLPDNLADSKGPFVTTFAVPPAINATDSLDVADLTQIGYSPSSRFEAIITSFDRTENYGVPCDQVANAEWYIERYGGYGNATLNLHGSVGDGFFNPDNLPGFARVEFVVDGVTRYVGFITRPSQVLSTPIGYSITFFGLFQMIGQIGVRQNFVYGGQADLSVHFSSIASKSVVPSYPNTVVISNLCGVTRDTSNYRGRLVSAAFNALVDESSNTATWGCYHLEDGLTRPDTLEFGPLGDFNNPDFSLVVPSTGVTGSSGEIDYSQVKNTLNLFGGPRTNPNLFPNGDMSQPIRAGEGAGNLIIHPSFDGGPSEPNWDWGGTTGIKQASDGNYGQPFAGQYMAYLYHDGAYIHQRRYGVDIIAGDTYIASIFERIQVESSPITFQAHFTWLLGLDGSGNPISGDTTTINLTSEDSAWTKRLLQMQAPTGAHGFDYRVELSDSGSGASPDHGMFLDFAEVYDLSGITQTGLEIVTFGGLSTNTGHDGGVHTVGAVINTQNWIYPDCPSVTDSGYCLYLDANSYDVNGEDLHIQLKGQARYSINSGQSVGMVVYLKTMDPTGSPKMLMEVDGYKNDGSQRGGIAQQTINAGALLSDSAAEACGGTPAGNGWYAFRSTRTGDGEEVAGTAWLTQRGNGKILISCFGIRDIVETTWVPAGNYFLRIRSDDARLDYIGQPGVTDSDSILAIQNSWLSSNYGPREGDANVPSISNDTDGLTFAAPWLAQNAIPSNAPRVTLIDPAERFLPGQTVYIGGDFGITLTAQTQAIARVRESWDGKLMVSLDMSREWRDEASWVAELIDERVKITNGTPDGSTAGAQGAAQPSVGGNSGSGSYLGVPTFGGLAHTATDGTLHDAYRTGPHLSDAERTAFAGVVAEVITARTSVTNSTAYASLEARLEAIEAAIAAL